MEVEACWLSSFTPTLLSQSVTCRKAHMYVHIAALCVCVCVCVLVGGCGCVLVGGCVLVDGCGCERAKTSNIISIKSNIG